MPNQGRSKFDREYRQPTHLKCCPTMRRLFDKIIRFDKLARPEKKPQRLLAKKLLKGQKTQKVFGIKQQKYRITTNKKSTENRSW